ncbi:MAG: Thiamine pyrophosphate enzyme C-terminal binding domain [Bacillota bacterium]|jgi:acetolactate synthase-1/2/3 large subunit|nr:Thiamine pyrophosphate enzyme C-terminal binding domain [Bacillota bacterium]
MEIKRMFDGDLPKAEPRYKFNNPDFSRLAEDFGAVGVRIEDPSEIGAAIKKAMTVNKPVVIEVLTDPEVFIPNYI